MELQQILDAIGTKPELLDGLMPVVFDSEKGKTAIENRVNASVQEKINAEIAKTHSAYDDDAFAIIGERPETKADGQKEKSYDFMKRKLADYKRLLDVENTLNADEKVKALNAEVERLKKEGGGTMVQEMFEKAKKDWSVIEEDYKTKIENLGKNVTKVQISNTIAQATAGLKFNPDVSDVIKNMVLRSAEEHLLNNHKIEGDKIFFLDKEGKPLLNPTDWTPKTASQVLADFDGIKEIILKNNTGGGGADPVVKGGVKTKNVDGKDVQTLDLPAGSFTSKKQFIDVAEKALIASGFTRRDPKWDNLLTASYKEHEVSKLPNE